MRFHLKISHKGLILVSVPLLLELIFVGLLSSLLQQAEGEIEREAHSKDVIEHANILMQDIVDASTAAAAYSFLKSRAFAARQESAISAVKDEFGELDKLVANDPEQLSNLGRFREAADGVIAKIASLKASDDQHMTLSSMISDPETLDELEKAMHPVDVQLLAFLKREKEVETASPATQASTQKLIEQSLIGAVVLNVLFAVALTAFFISGITRRLKVLTENTFRLSRGQRLYPLLSGGDEIADLDRVFHSMACSLQEVESRKQQLIGIVANKLQAPLTSVERILTSVYSGEQGEISSPVKHKLQIAEVDIMRLISLINDLLDVQKVESGQLEMSAALIPLARALERSIRAVEGFAAQKRVFLSCPPTDVTVFADEGRLIQVLVNLLSNAIKFSSSEQTVSLAVEERDNMVEVLVIDQGRGIKAEALDLIFERFTQAEVSDAVLKGGSGLGLSICKTIIEQLGGTIWVKSEPGKGSTFHFRVPASDSASRLIVGTSAEPARASEEKS